MAVASVTETTQYLTFNLDGEVFAIDISKVREVLEFTSVTTVPKMPHYIIGVINIRGNVVPVVDMRIKFGMTKGEKTVNTCVIIVEVKVENDNIILGALVDSVEEVIELEPESIEPAPSIGVKLDTEFIKGMGKRDEVFIIILEIDRIFLTKDLEAISLV
ncbi:MAG: purine-binding chemotaxis protein CheW [Nitrospirae bacterium]|nr:purine-binding chemotaxis protein CheW [Nitrospirota bacterium]MBF0534237.1 purine-binding chemotaxis protein CheW [Nitrospirota bacterium]MBF0615849.1 purine-binding chemotaxis protein CheW [Nitrospirota bacterium]